jgi:hypothetical protein
MRSVEVGLLLGVLTSIGACADGKTSEAPPPVRKAYVGVDSWKCFGDELGCDCTGLSKTANLHKSRPEVSECSKDFDCCSIMRTETDASICVCSSYDAAECELQRAFAGGKGAKAIEACPPAADLALCAGELENCGSDELGSAGLSGCCPSLDCVTTEDGSSQCRWR